MIWKNILICDVLFAAAYSATLAPQKEVPALIPGSSSHPADILPVWNAGIDLQHVSVISPLQHQTLHAAASTPGHAIQVAIWRKLTSNLPGCMYTVFHWL